MLTNKSLSPTASGFRSIDVSKFINEESPTELGPASQLLWLPLKDLRIDESYQRPLAAQGERTVKKIIKSFDWRKFAPVIVSPIAGGLYAIVDGQHRTTAAACCGIETVPCAVILADQRTQAEAFGAINGTVTKVSRQQQHKAALVAGDPVALKLGAVTKAAGVRILTSNKTAMEMKPGDTIAITIIKRMLDQHGDEVVTRGLKAIVASAGELGGYLKAPIIFGVVSVLAQHSDWNNDVKLKAAFEQLDLDQKWRESQSAALTRRSIIASDFFQTAIQTHLFKTY